MSNIDIDYIEAELRLTTSAGSRVKWPPTSGHWGNAWKRLESLRTATPPPPSTPVPVGAVIFEDDFNGTTIDTAKWDIKTFGPNDPSCLALDGHGNLVVSAKKQADGSWWTGFASGQPSTAYNGPRYIEARLMAQSGLGTWNGAIWEWPWDYGKSPGLEVDVCEQLGKEPQAYHATLHNWDGGTNPQAGCSIATGLTLAADFHVYGAAVYPDRVDFYLDGVQKATILAAAIGLEDLTTWKVVANTNMQMGGWGGTIDPALTSAAMLVDYIRVYRLAS